MRLAFALLFTCAALLLTRGELQSPKPDSLVETAPVVVATRDIPAGAVIGYQSLAVSPAPGKRAYSIRVDDAAGLVSMVQPNSRVDIMVVIADARGARGPVAKLFMSNVRVLAIGRLSTRRSDGRPIDATVATVEVSPEAAEQLAITSAQGQLQLVLRGNASTPLP